MNFSSEIQKDNLFHAYVLEGDSAVLHELKEYLAEILDMRMQGNPDVLLKEYEMFGVDSSREIARFAQMRPIGEKKVICISAPSMTVEAQDALLKLFEEPPANTHFFVVLPSVQALRSTLLSRVRVIQKTLMVQEPLGPLAKEFLESTYADRLKTIAKIAKDKNKAAALELLNNLETELYQSKGSEPSILEAIIQARKYMRDKGAMLKMLLESVAIQIPIIKN